jgi:Wax ester synthase-like Acyl-CoA acyltransferase domain
METGEECPGVARSDSAGNGNQVHSSSHATWEDDADFQIENHVKRHVLSGGCSEADLIRAAMNINERAQPFASVLGDALIRGLSGDRTTLLSRLHHSMVDGFPASGF